MNDQDQAGLGWTVVLRRQPVRIVAGQAEGGYTDAYELVCCPCGDHPDLDYREVSPPSFSTSAGPTRSRRASRRMRGTSSDTTARRRPPSGAARRDRSRAYRGGIYALEA